MNKKSLLTVAVLGGLSVAFFGTSANADPPRVAHQITPSERRIEGQPADPPGYVTIKYGVMGGGMTSKQLGWASYRKCENAIFGDPAPNQKKACYLANGSKLADEGQMMTLPGPECPRVPVKYVAVNGASKERSFCAGRTVRCDNAVFGTDPAVGVVKHCEKNGQTVAQENKTFLVPFQEVCLCGGKAFAQLTEIVEDTAHD